ncbi:unnamed protein product [Rotaria sordida]|uniref:Uncharacterized protein n=1 Tax=Rotaria sordida TaxID=392033 RepID=A0A815D325_9BILA|nr:unnamed protein product [Rotaria sordida]
MVGYNSKNLDDIQSLYKCNCCSLIFREPVQLIDCGHRMCQSCASEQSGNTITCAECGEQTMREKLLLDRGFKNDMQTLLIICSLCSWTGLLNIYQNHLDQNHPNPVCDSCSQKFNSVNDLDRHIQHDCEKITLNCPLKQIGCEEMVLRLRLAEHYISDQHQRILANFVRQMSLILSNNLNNHSLIGSYQRIDMDPNEFEKISNATNILLDNIKTLVDELERLTLERDQIHNKLQSFIQETTILKKSIEEENSSIDGINHNQQITEQNLLSMEQKLNNMSLSSYDGTFTWKITNVQEKITAAKSRTQTSIYSPPFYSSSTGYKMCLRLYLNGDGNAQNTHISLFFVLMRGEYDAILSFPFCFKVIFCLYDQTNQQNHIIDSFQPDVRSNSFQRPRSDMNIASGLPKFAPLTIFQQENNPYVRNDIIFITVTIDFNNTPKTILPYMFNLSPALTTQIKQTMIRQETEKQQQVSNSPTMNFEGNQSITMEGVSESHQ